MDIQRTQIALSDPQFSRVEEGIRESYPNACVLWIEQIENPALERLYQQQKLEIETKRKQSCSELLLYHGTTESAVGTIIHHGFNPERNVRSVYGKGSYFAKNASYSRDYAPPRSDKISFMLLCSVLVGNVAVYGNSYIIDTTLHDNSVDHLDRPSIYVTPYTYGAIPRYVIAFYRDAR
jgi:hypothetical protein